LAQLRLPPGWRPSVSQRLSMMRHSPAAQGAGAGSALMEEVEGRLAGVARLIVVETSGRAAYAPTRAFYQARGYRMAAVVAEFYAAGDAQVIFTKAPTAVGR